MSTVESRAAMARIERVKESAEDALVADPNDIIMQLNAVATLRLMAGYARRQGWADVARRADEYATELDTCTD